MISVHCIHYLIINLVLRYILISTIKILEFIRFQVYIAICKASKSNVIVTIEVQEYYKF